MSILKSPIRCLFVKRNSGDENHSTVSWFLLYKMGYCAKLPRIIGFRPAAVSTAATIEPVPEH